MNENSRFIGSLTGLRYVAAVTVAVGHGALALRHDWLAQLVAQISSIGMTLFFVLSGFVLWLNYAESFGTKPLAEAMRSFAIARFARLYPMYAVVVLGIVALKGGDPHAVGFVLTMTQAWFPALEGKMLVAVIPSIQHLWSISVEFFFYLLFPLICIALARVRRPATVMVLALVNLLAFAVAIFLFFRYGDALLQTVAPRLTDSGMQWLTYYGPYLRVPQFLAGCLVAMIYLDRTGKPVRRAEGRLVAGLFWLSAAGLVLLPILLFFQPSMPDYYLAIELAVRLGEVAFFSIIMLGASRYGLARFLSWRAVIIGGECSYSVYLLHPFLMRIAMIGASDVMSVPEFVFRLCLFVGVTTAIAWGCYSLIEAPSRAWLRRALGTTAPRDVLHTT
ncbi:MAG TPA: acyltransferase [Bradyrhizobium sp.]|uniref:acyltransferase family protein n=1 Tax=Bradyrhizobium sp. TaxID=376 RepID=UPI002B663BE9|nr:acyltransferase [Bradyrhizobium sp.]HLZ03217.1 acyltransferase [Bradyrhizobium sp.]